MKSLSHINHIIKYYLLYLITFPFFFISFLYLVSNWVDVPYYDEWRMVQFIECWQKGSCGILSLLERDNNHIIFFEKTFELFSFTFFRLDPRVEMFFGLMFINITIIILIFYIYEISHEINYTHILAFVTIVALFLNLRNWENLLGPWSINTASATFFFILSIYYLCKNSFLLNTLSICFCFLS